MTRFSDYPFFAHGIKKMLNAETIYLYLYFTAWKLFLFFFHIHL